MKRGAFPATMRPKTGRLRAKQEKIPVFLKKIQKTFKKVASHTFTIYVCVKLKTK